MCVLLLLVVAVCDVTGSQSTAVCCLLRYIPAAVVRPMKEVS